MNTIKIYFIAIFMLFSFPLTAMMENDELLHGTYLIKNIKHGEYLFVADGDRINGDRAVEGRSSIYYKSFFTFEKNSKGYLIKNVKHGEYLFLADGDRKNGDRLVEASPEIMEKSYFDIFSYGSRWIIRNKKHNEKLFLANEDRMGGGLWEAGDRLVEAHAIHYEKSEFELLKWQSERKLPGKYEPLHTPRQSELAKMYEAILLVKEVVSPSQPGDFSMGNLLKSDDGVGLYEIEVAKLTSSGFEPSRQHLLREG